MAERRLACGHRFEHLARHAAEAPVDEPVHHHEHHPDGVGYQAEGLGQDPQPGQRHAHAPGPKQPLARRQPERALGPGEERLRVGRRLAHQAAFERQIVPQVDQRRELGHGGLPGSHRRRIRGRQQPAGECRAAHRRAHRLEQLHQRGRAEQVEVGGVGVLRIGALRVAHGQRVPGARQAQRRLVGDALSHGRAFPGRRQLFVVGHEPDEDDEAQPRQGVEDRLLLPEAPGQRGDRQQEDGQPQVRDAVPTPGQRGVRRPERRAPLPVGLLSGHGRLRSAAARSACRPRSRLRPTRRARPRGPAGAARRCSAAGANARHRAGRPAAIR